MDKLSRLIMINYRKIVWLIRFLKSIDSPNYIVLYIFR